MSRRSKLVLVSVLCCLGLVSAAASSSAATIYTFTQVFGGYGTLTGSFVVDQANAERIQHYDGAGDAISDLEIAWVPFDDGAIELAAFTAKRSISTDGSNYLIFMLGTPSSETTYDWTGTFYSPMYGGAAPEMLLGCFDMVGTGTFVKYIGGNPAATGAATQTGALLIYDSGPSPTQYATTSALTASATAAPVTAVPEPASLLLLGAGLVGAASFGRTQKRK